jgi:hypothetical protein
MLAEFPKIYEEKRLGILLGDFKKNSLGHIIFWWKKRKQYELTLNVLLNAFVNAMGSKMIKH